MPRYEILPGGGSPKRPKSSPAKKVANHILSQLRRPVRWGGRPFMAMVMIGGMICLLLSRRHADDIQRTATNLSIYVPSRITGVINQFQELQNTRWDDNLEVSKSVSSSDAKPKFHLLIPSSTSTANLCTTLLSAAILNYPPPTLVSYGASGGNEQLGGDVVRNTLGFLLGKEAHDDDLILVVEEGSWLQLPAEVTINRFFHGTRDVNAKLLEKYGKINGNSSELPSGRAQKYTQKVLFGAQKECSNLSNEPACYYVPQSPLAKDIYGPNTDRHSNSKYNRPRYMGSNMVMGKVSDLLPIYKYASELLESDEIGKHGSQYVFSQIFGEQEYARTIHRRSTLGSGERWREWLASKFGTNTESPHDPSIAPTNMSLAAGRNSEFSIGLDYASKIFQVMNNSVDDVKFIAFNQPSILASPSSLSASSFKIPIHLPLDLNVTSPPFMQHFVSSAAPNPPITEVDNIPQANLPWDDVELATNVVVPGSSVPSSLNFHGSGELLKEWWPKMWYQPHARALLRQYIRSPDGPIAAEAAAEGGEKWWDLRGGKGGMWTDKGEWLSWNEVCGAFDGEVFADGKGVFGHEEQGGAEKPVYNSFGKLVAGKEKLVGGVEGPSDKEENRESMEAKLEEEKKVEDERTSEEFIQSEGKEDKNQETKE